jgi:cytoplasmic iron level regulating protein YaaA (DUF328/UPF0246 family)
LFLDTGHDSWQAACAEPTHQSPTFISRLEDMTNPFLILLPPSEGKAPGGSGAPLDLDALSFSELNKTREQLIKSVGQLSGKPRVAQKVLGVKGVALETFRADNAAVNEAPTLPAIERYTGVMFDAIDYKSMDESSKSSFAQNTLIMSGLFGLVRPFDLIPTYKLKMGAKIRQKKACSAIWKPLITKVLASRTDQDVIWDLLPNEHSAAWDPSGTSYETRFTIKFLEAGKDGQLKTVNHWSKALKGALIRLLVANPDAASDADSAIDLLERFSHPEGYKFRPELTTDSDNSQELMFIKG